MAGRFFILRACLEEERLERRRRRRQLREGFDLYKISDVEFIFNYRLSRELFQTLCEEIVPLLRPKRNSRGIDPIVKILTALNFYARGSYQGSVGQNLEAPMSQQSVSKCIREVTAAINTPAILRKYIKFPQNRVERNAIKRKFYELYNIPGVIGCIDCSHIAIVRPDKDEERYFNRKHFHSLNAQVICDAACYILDVDASYGGATHDSFIWANSEIKSHLENHEDGTFLLGDSGYALREYLITPFENVPEDSPEGRFNIKHKCARSTIERTFGILTGRWRCLLAARELHYVPETASKITIACCVLHNMCIQAGLGAPELTEEDLSAESNRQVIARTVQSSTEALQRGQRARARLVQSVGNDLKSLFTTIFHLEYNDILISKYPSF